MSSEPEDFSVEVNFLADEIETLRVFTKLSVDRLAGFMVLKLHDGTKVTVGLRDKALQALCEALIEKSPRTPGTPGRN